jgi:hypothetical protein
MIQPQHTIPLYPISPLLLSFLKSLNFTINSLIIFCCSKIRIKNKDSPEKFSLLVFTHETYSLFLHRLDILWNNSLFSSRNAYSNCPRDSISLVRISLFELMLRLPSFVQYHSFSGLDKSHISTKF